MLGLLSWTVSSLLGLVSWLLLYEVKLGLPVWVCLMFTIYHLGRAPYLSAKSMVLLLAVVIISSICTQILALACDTLRKWIDGKFP